MVINNFEYQELKKAGIPREVIKYHCVIEREVDVEDVQVQSIDKTLYQSNNEDDRRLFLRG